MVPKRLSVLGVGLLGGSLGLAVKSIAKDCRVVGYGHRRATLETALATKAIDEAYDDPAAAVRDADLVVLCTPVGLLAEMLDQISPFLAKNAVVTDVGSTKGSIVRLAEERHPGVRFVGSHPMAGSEKRGVQYAQVDLFRNAFCITTPTDKTDRDALERVEAFWRQLGMRLKRISPADHDRLICDVSHLPHAVAAAMVTMQDDAALELVGKGFLDATRIAGGDGALWRDILLDNRENVLDSIQRLQSTLHGLEGLLRSGRSDELRTWLDHAAQRRQRAAPGTEPSTSGK